VDAERHANSGNVEMMSRFRTSGDNVQDVKAQLAQLQAQREMLEKQKAQAEQEVQLAQLQAEVELLQKERAQAAQAQEAQIVQLRAQVEQLQSERAQAAQAQDGVAALQYQKTADLHSRGSSIGTSQAEHQFADMTMGRIAEKTPSWTRGAVVPRRQSEAPLVPRRQSEAPLVLRRQSDILQQPQEKVSKAISKSDIILVQGGSLKTWSYRISPDRVQVVLSTDGRPLDADVTLWQGPDNSPCKMHVFSEDGSSRPFSAVIVTPNRSASTVAIRNVGMMEFPLAAYVTAKVDEPMSDFYATSTTIQGGAIRTFDFDPAVESVEVMVKTDGRPLNARIELLQGPNNNKQVIELYADDGLARPFFAIIDTMGSGNVVRVQNTAPIEFPMTASVQPHYVDESFTPFEPVIGGDA
jgi:hypothetical protein